MVYDFMHQRMILFVLYGLFHKFHANVAISCNLCAFFTKLEISQVSCDNRIKTQNIVWTLKKISQRGVFNTEFAQFTQV